jgi:hypothetical protein
LYKRVFFGFLIFIILISFSYSEEIFKAGVAKIDITPPVGTQLAGYSDRVGKKSLGVNDPLYAKCLILASSEEKIAIITADMFYLRNSLYYDLCKEIENKIGIKKENIIFAVSHSHSSSGEIFKELSFIAGKYNPKIYKSLLGKLVKLVIEANNNLKEAKFASGSGKVENCAVNRRFGGTITDPEVGVIRIDDAKTGKCIAILFNYAAHPTVLGSDNLLFSADWPGYAQKAIEKVKNGAIALYTNGAQGDQAPGLSNIKNGFERCERIGNIIAGEVLKVAENLFTTDKVKIKIVSSKLLLNPKINEYAEIKAVSLNDTLILTIPGEAFSYYGLKFKEEGKKRNFKNVYCIGLACGGIGYIMSKEDYLKHEYETLLSLYGKELGDFIEKEIINLMDKIKEN